MADQPSLEAEQLLHALADHEVEYVLIGGVAIQAYGHVRTTLDLDVIAAWTPENMRRLAEALGELGARLRGVDADLLGIDLTDPRQLYAGGNFLMRTAHGDLDVFAVEQTPGAPRSYDQLSGRAVPVEVLGVRLLVAHPEDLIRMKSAAAQFRDRPEPKRRQDLDDIAVLERLRTEHPTERGEAGRTTTGRSGPRTSPRATTGSEPPGRKDRKLGR
jgi:hypothetical protein